MARDGTAERFSVREFAALVVLAAHGRELENPQFVELAGFALTGAARQRLVSLGLIHSRRVGRAYAHQLTDEGWRRCRQLFAEARPGRAGSAGGALFALLDGVDRALLRDGRSYRAFFAPPADDPAGAVPRQRSPDEDVVTAIRAAYRRLAASAGAWVGLADLREELSGYRRGELDDGLRQLATVPGVSLIPVATVDTLSPRDRRAALRTGDLTRHALRIEPP